ncbi:hypothetical protein AB0I46_30800 [Streptomyces spectabilis]
MALNQQVAEIDKRIEARFRGDHQLSGTGPILGAELLAATA